ncbi:hypothetical protein [Cellulosimicrobium sp. CUA-896]|uniref:hypothetical protein n=1 Tax=Cellulosimicrobium sp. CUA-896 TaxID=1517881 RepID=UPI000964E57D|nr:hypothetical protein [Cellulosimicrobium sp. CUA-896]OLT46846.1 hypothetical protein BJF88_04540 [Cellulosimicrobium sp. CUA-896]
MAWMFVWLGITLGAAAVVFLFASVVARAETPAPDDEGLRGFWRNFRSGLRGGRRREPRGTERPATVRLPRPVDTSMDDFFAATEVHTPAYVDAEELTEVWHRARERAVRPLHHHGVRARPVAHPAPLGPGHGALPAPVPPVPSAPVPAPPPDGQDRVPRA